ncbi:LLM class flavin-dependent oxidoreductase [Streptomyces sp. NBC_01455]|uniref:LLM class flavin-dependent oxidoreductase n=1 Tax=Streptomyces sp. NBC_01455 TaxID=2903874 RepID=UPI002E3416DB|nr:LLM class flavin-dependent oxidoreductase [Streptomyces sp. NBC_01455]
MTVRTRGGIHLAAHLPGGGGLIARTGSYEGPRTGSYEGPRTRSYEGPPNDPYEGPRTDFASFEHLARTAERGLFDFLLLTESPRPREHRGTTHDPGVVGHPEPLTVLHGLAAVTGRLGLAAAVGAGSDESYGLARRLATLDHLSGGRAAWATVTSRDTVPGEDLRRDGAPDPADRRRGGSRPTRTTEAALARSAEFVERARELWESCPPEGVPRASARRGRRVDVAGEFGVPRSPQGHPVIIHADGSGGGREFAASTAEVVITRHRTPQAGREFRADMERRLATYGRAPGDLKIMPAVTVVLGDTAAEARERAADIRRQGISEGDLTVAPREIRGAGLSSYDPDGPLPEAYGPPSYVGTPEAVAAELDAFVTAGAADGFVLVPRPAPGGLDEFVDRVVPLLQERGAFRTEYTGTTLRSHLGSARPLWKG